MKIKQEKNQSELLLIFDGIVICEYTSWDLLKNMQIATSEIHKNLIQQTLENTLDLGSSQKFPVGTFGLFNRLKFQDRCTRCK